MGLVKTSPNETMIRIEEEEGGAVTVLLPEGSGTARILSLTVPEGEDAGHTAQKLLSEAEKEAFESGAVYMEADFPGYTEEDSEVFRQMGYEIAEGAPLVAVDINRLLTSKCVRRSLQLCTDEAAYFSFGEMDINRTRKVGAFLSFVRIDEEFSDPGFYSMEYSGAVFDGANDVRAVILSTEVADGIRVDLLLGRTNKDANYILSAVKGMVVDLAGGRGSKLKRIYVIEANKITETLLARVLGKDNIPERLGLAMHAKKSLIDTYEDENVPYRSDEEEDDKWRQDAARDLFQVNLAWKMAWNREHN